MIMTDCLIINAQDPMQKTYTFILMKTIKTMHFSLDTGPISIMSLKIYLTLVSSKRRGMVRCMYICRKRVWDFGGSDDIIGL